MSHTQGKGGGVCPGVVMRTTPAVGWAILQADPESGIEPAARVAPRGS